MLGQKKNKKKAVSETRPSLGRKTHINALVLICAFRTGLSTRLKDNSFHTYVAE